jgi:hypothetical protein
MSVSVIGNATDTRETGPYAANIAEINVLHSFTYRAHYVDSE